MPGTVLLLAASPVGRGRLVDAAGVLPVLAAVAPAVLSGTDTANVVELADPLEPQAVLTRLRAAATASGPLTVYIAGQLQLDRRQRLPHLALARTTAATVRYTGLPWHWIREELRLRSAADTGLVVDLHAEGEAWQYVAERGLDCGPNSAVYGRVVAVGGRRGVGEPAYMKAVATLLRSGYRPPLGQLHEQALARVGESGAGPGLILATAGRTAPRPAFAPPPTSPGRPENQTTTLPGTAQDPYAVIGAGQVPSVVTGTAQDPYAVVGAGQVRDAVTGAVQFPSAVTGAAQVPSAVTGAGQVPSVVTGTAQDPYALVGAGQVRDVVTGAGRGRGAGVGAAPGGHVGSGAGADPHALISVAVQAGRHADAEVLAARHEQFAVRDHGPASDEALHWAEVRADLAMFAGDAARSCRAWLAVARTRLSAGQAVDSPAVEAAVDRAHHQWGRITDVTPARELGPVLAELRLRVPGRRSGALENVQRQLRQLQAAP
ncbi:hypothetical protein [Streptomyces sp. NPDC001851]|uniref:hypothetical protein n=1 Tax=Streptomyces sp. NPDC001851 TaxID=3154529 RepID=UPI00332059C5